MLFIGNDYTPLKSKLLDVSSCIEQRDKRSYSPRALSPSIPPNPPSSPVDEVGGGDQRRPPGSRKLNVNATPFVPGGPKMTLVENNHHTTSLLAAKSSSHSTTSSFGTSVAPDVKSSTVRHLDFSAKEAEKTAVDQTGGSAGGGEVIGNGGVKTVEGTKDGAGGMVEGVGGEVSLEGAKGGGGGGGGVCSEDSSRGKGADFDIGGSGTRANGIRGVSAEGGGGGGTVEQVMCAESAVAGGGYSKVEVTVENADSAVDNLERSLRSPSTEEMPWPNLVHVQTAGQVTAASRTTIDSRTEAVVVTCKAEHDAPSVTGSSGGSHCPGLSPDSIDVTPSGIAMATTPEGTGIVSPETTSSQSGSVSCEGLNSDLTPNQDQQQRTSSISKTTPTTSSTTPTFEPAQAKNSRETTPTSPSSTELTTSQDKGVVVSSPESAANSAELNATPSVGMACKAPMVKSWASIVSCPPADSSGPLHSSVRTPQAPTVHSQPPSLLPQTRTNGQKTLDKVPKPPAEAESEGAKEGVKALVKPCVDGVKANGVGSRGGKGKEDRREGYSQFRMLGGMWGVESRGGSNTLSSGCEGVGSRGRRPRERDTPSSE